MVPKLRFPEFLGAKEWDVKKVDELGQTLNGLTGKTASDFGSGKPFVTYKQVFDSAWIDFEKCARATIADGENQNELHLGDILITTSSETPEEVGFASVIMASPPESLYLNSFCFALRPHNLNTLKPQFSQYIFRSSIYRKLVQVLAQGSTRFNISKGSFLELSLPIPLEKEQQKIADCLSSLDDLITAQAQKLKALQAHKKGLMQEVFPAEGERVPRRRFGEFEGAGEWEVDIFDGLLEVIDGDRGINYPKAEDFYNPEHCVFLNAKNVTKNGFSFNEIQCITKGKDESLRKGKLKRSDIVLTTRGSVGQFAIYNKEVPFDNLRINSGMVILRVNKELISPEYFYHFCKSDLVSSTVKNLAFGNAQQQLTVAIIKQLPLYFPKKDEQQKLASLLTSLDDLITAHTQKLEALKAHKKGLMQQLFPDPNEIEA